MQSRIINWHQSKPNGSIAVGLNFSSPSLSLYHIEKVSVAVPGFFPVAKCIVRPKPSPNSTLRTGPAIVPVIAISANPFLVIATSALQSPNELPQAMTVSPKKALGRVVTNPQSYKRSIIVSDVNLIHMILIMNANNEYIIIIQSGGLVTFVKNLTKIPITTPGMTQ